MSHAEHWWSMSLQKCSCGTTAESLLASEIEGHPGEHWLCRLMRRKAEDTRAGIVYGTYDVTTGEYYPDES